MHYQSFFQKFSGSARTRHRTDDSPLPSAPVRFETTQGEWALAHSAEMAILAKLRIIRWLQWKEDDICWRAVR